MHRENKDGVVGDAQRVRRDGQPLRLNPRNFRQQGLGVDHHAVADDAQLAAHEAGRQQGQLIGLIPDHQRMPCIMPALVSHDHICSAREPIDDLPLALVAPLGADHGDIGHWI